MIYIVRKESRYGNINNVVVKVCSSYANAEQAIVDFLKENENNWCYYNTHIDEYEVDGELIQTTVFTIDDQKTMLEESIRKEQRELAVHASHCCKWHGCKYGDENCPVVTGKVKQLYTCEYCDDELDDIEYHKAIVARIDEMTNIKFEALRRNSKKS